VKDSLGHGSGPRNSSSRVDFGRSRVAIEPGASFSRNPKSWAPTTDTQRTVENMRNRLASTGSDGHKRTLMQGIRNLLGC
jgi:hypothetical protein